MTVTVVAEPLIAVFSVAVTVAVPRFSEIELSFSDSVAVPSSSTMVPVPVAMPSVALVGLLSVTSNVSDCSASPSFVISTVNVLLVSPAAKASGVELTAV